MTGPDTDTRPKEELEIWELGASEVAARVASGELSAVAVVEACLERTERVEPAVRAYVAVEGELALERAAEVDRLVASGEDPGPLAGVPVAIKDNLALAGRPLTCASRILDGYVAPESATAVARLLDAGAVPVGRANLDELAMGSSTETSIFGATKNPWNPSRVPGGSSGGPAAAVASCGVPLALGSDTGGSVRQPAAFCGVVGLRPTWGRVSRRGLVAFASSLDQVGPLARSVRDVALCLGVVAGADPGDATTSDRPVPPFAEEVDRFLPDAGGLRIGTLPELAELSEQAGDKLSSAADLDFRRALDRLAGAGAEIVELSAPAVRSSLPAYTVLAAAEASSNLARFDGVRYGRRAGGDGGADAVIEASRSEGFGAEVTRRVLLGTFALSAGYAERYYGRAQAVRSALARQLASLFERVDLIATPTAAGGAFPLGSRLHDPVTMYRSDLFTTPASLAGLPAVSVPSGVDDDGLPLGLQLVGAPFGEVPLLRAAALFERLTGLERTPVPAETVLAEAASEREGAA